MINANINTIVEDMDLQETIQDMIKEAIDQCLMEQRGFNEDGEAVFALSNSGRKLVETSDLSAYLKHQSETDLDGKMGSSKSLHRPDQREDTRKE